MTCYNITASDFVLNNNASLSGDIVTLTPDALSQNGSVWGKMRINLDYDFKVTSSIYLGTDDGGADGIAFVLQPLSSNAGSSGGGMGYQGISPSYAVEFDTYYNGGADPTSNDHIAIVKNGEGSIAAHSPYSARSNLEDGNWHDAIFEWNATTKYFKVTYEGSVLFNVNIDLTSSVFNNNSNVYWGFTAATGGCKNLQRVDISEYCCSRAASTPPTITAFNDVTICPNTPTSAIGFTIADNESEWGQMSVSATSSNQSVIPESNIVFGGSEGSRTITLSPASNQQGYSDITVTVTDADGQTDSEVFTLTVEDVTPPVLSVVNDTVTDYSVDQVRALADVVHDNENVAAAVASGSFLTRGMLVAPCTIKTLSAIANSFNYNLLTRAADVTLKERRPLVLMVRETPLHKGHLDLMRRAADLGAVILPPVPAFYHKPKTLNDIIHQSIGKALDMFGLEHNLFERWR